MCFLESWLLQERQPMCGTIMNEPQPEQKLKQYSFFGSPVQGLIDVTWSASWEVLSRSHNIRLTFVFL